MQTYNRDVIKKALVVETKHQLKIHYSHVASENRVKCQFKDRDGKIAHQGEGATEDAAFQNAFASFNPNASEDKRRDLEATNIELEKKIRSLESELEAKKAPVSSDSDGANPALDDDGTKAPVKKKKRPTRRSRSDSFGL